MITFLLTIAVAGAVGSCDRLDAVDTVVETDREEIVSDTTAHAEPPETIDTLATPGTPTTPVVPADTIPEPVSKIRKIAGGIDNLGDYDGHRFSGQGFAVHDSIGYRLYNTGVCSTYDLSDIEAPKKISTFYLGSYMPKNHSNCAQFGADSLGNPLLYVSGLRGKCFVERISPEGSQLVQTIHVPAMEVYDISTGMNLICGDDGYLWGFGNALSDSTLTFVKFRRPDLSEGDVYLNGNDILDIWYEKDYVYRESVWQGGKVYDGRLYFVFGQLYSNRHIAIYDTATHEKVSDIDLNAAVREEPEDCELVDGKILLTIYNGDGYYLIDPD